MFRRVRKLRKETSSFVIYVFPSVRLSISPSAWNNSAPTERILIKFEVFLENLSRKPDLH
jgi:hypothetical protein